MKRARPNNERINVGTLRWMSEIPFTLCEVLHILEGFVKTYKLQVNVCSMFSLVVAATVQTVSPVKWNRLKPISLGSALHIINVREVFGLWSLAFHPCKYPPQANWIICFVVIENCGRLTNLWKT